MRCSLFWTFSLLTIVDAEKIRGYLKKSDIPSSGKDWVTLDNGVQFQAAESSDPRIEHARRLWGKDKEVEEGSPFVDGTETYYDEYAQAWRLLGFYIDCDHCSGDDDYNGNKAECLNQDDGDEQACQRFLLWAAYVDLDYSGNEVAEYQYYDRKNSKWINSACKDNNSKRCVKMDCHEPTTHFSLLGLFKEPDYGTFLEQLFKHQGDCVWTDEEYALMQENRDAWPQECTYVDDNLYYDTKPGAKGSMEIGLYTDARCIYEYEGDYTAEEVIAQMSENDDDSTKSERTLEEEMDAWNDAFDAFKICQPCKTSSLLSIVAADETVDADGDRYQAGDDDNNDDDAGAFTCHDDAGYNDVNQCAKFREKTPMLTASYRDLMLAESQGTVTGINIRKVQFRGVSNEQEEKNGRRKRLLHILLSVFLLYGVIAFLLFAIQKLTAARKASNSDESKRVPLMQKIRRRRSNDTRGTDGS